MQKIGVAFFLVVLATPLAHAQGPVGRSFGFGLTVGEPTGATGKYWFDDRNTLAFSFGWGFWPHDGPAFAVDYEYNVFTFLRAGKVPFDLQMYMGVGLKLGFWSHHDHPEYHYDGAGLGIRIPVGVHLVFAKYPFDVFFETVPVVSFVNPDPFWFDFDVATGGRFYF